MRFVLVLFLLVLATQGSAMAFFGKKQEVVLASPLSGKVTFEKNDVSGVKVERLLEWSDDQSFRQETVTNSEGVFSFPSVVRELEINPLSTMVKSQDINIYHNGEEKTVFSTATHQHDLYSEFGGEEPEGFICELTDEDVPVRKEGALILTSCKWKGI